MTGKAKFTGDLDERGTLVGRILRSPVSHGRIHSIATDRAEALEGSLLSSPARIATRPMA